MSSVSQQRELEIEDAVLLIRINQLYESDMTPRQLYDCTRGVWAVGPRRERAKYAPAVFQGEVLEAYEIGDWHPAGSTHYESREIDLERYDGRWEFTGRTAPEEVRSKYVGESVAHYFKRGEANPVKYINC